MSTRHDIERTLSAFRDLLQYAETICEAEQYEAVAGVPNPHDPETIITGILDIGVGTYIVHRTSEVESATWFCVDIDETGTGFDVVAHATRWESKAAMLDDLLRSAISQLEVGLNEYNR